MGSEYGTRMRDEVNQGTVPFIGVYDAFSATVAGRSYHSLFLSGFGFAASYYGLPDIGFIAWSDMVAYVQRVRTVLPEHHLLVDIDDGYGDTEVACHVVSLLEHAGASAVILEDQQRPRRCGHYEGKRLMALDDFMPKLERVLATRRELFVVARTDSDDEHDMLVRAKAFAAAGADAVLVDAIPSLESLRLLREAVSCPIVCNQLAGGKTPSWSLGELGAAGVSIVIYSTPCLFAAQQAVEVAMAQLTANDGRLSAIAASAASLHDCTATLKDNLARRDTMPGATREDGYVAAA